MPRALILTIAIFVVALGGVQAQETPRDPAGAQITQAAPQDAVVAAPATLTQSSSPLPQQSAQARTMRAYWHVFIAFAVVWLLLFGYALTVGRRFGQLEEEVRRLRSTS